MKKDNDLETCCKLGEKEYLLEEWNYEKNKPLTPAEVSKRSAKKVWWILRYYDPNTEKMFDLEWEATIDNRFKGIGCPYLSGKAIKKGFNDLKTTNPGLAKEWHPIKNGDLTPEDVTNKSSKNVWWYLPYDDPVSGKHFDFEWQTKISNRTNGKGCPYLKGIKVWVGFNDLASTNPELASQWHPTKNRGFMPYDVTAFSGKKVWWYLPYDDPDTGKHFDFEWEAVIFSRTNGIGCPFISGKAVWPGFNDLETVCPDLAKEWHPTKNGNLTPQNVSAHSDKRIWWLLPYDDPISGKHFDFEWKAKIDNRARGKGCPYLNGYGVWPGFNDLATIKPELIKEFHPTKNGKLTPQNVSPYSHKKIWWIYSYDDPITGKHFDFEWKTTPQHRIEGNGCPYLSRQRAWPGFNDLVTENPEVAKEFHPTKNLGLDKVRILSTSIRKVWWKCDVCGYEWRTRVLDRVKGQGCPNCSKS